MYSSEVTQVFRKNIFPSHFINRRVVRVQCLQSSSFMFRNSRPADLFRSLFSTNINNAETGHKAEAVIQESSKAPKKKLATSLRGLERKKFINFSKDPDTPLGKNTWTLIRDNWKQVLGFGILMDILFALAADKVSEYWVNSALKNGTRPNSEVLEDEFVPRPQISETLKRIFQPNEHRSFYHVVCGEHGTGKTTLIRMEATNVGKGVIYVDIPSDFENLGKAFGKAINLSFFEDISITILLMRKFFSGMGVTSESAISLYQWRRVMKIFRHASKVYKKKYHKPPVIIYDNISRIVKENPKILNILQDDAKDNADDNAYIAVFVSNKGSVLQRMETRSAWSRAEKPVKEISDLSEKESKNYLIKRCTIKEEKKGKIIRTECKINDEQVNELYKLVGGRIVDLEAVINKFLARQSLEDIKQQVLTEVEKKFQSAQFLPNDLYYEVGKCIISDLLKSEEITFLAFKKYFNKIELNEVLESKIFAYHPEKTQ